MSHHRRSLTTSKSSENNLEHTNERPSRRSSQSSTGSSTRRTVYPNVPKRIRPLPSIDDEETIETESRIDIFPSATSSQINHGSSAERSASTRHALELITKYTSPKKKEITRRCLSPIEDENSTLDDHLSCNPVKSKRALSPLNETKRKNSQSKRTKSVLEDDDEEEEDVEELSQLLDHRYYKQISSQNSNPSVSSQSAIATEEKQPAKRKPTARKLSTSRSKPSASQPASIESIRIESWEPEIDQVGTSHVPKRACISQTQYQLDTEYDNRIDVFSPPTIPSPIKPSIDTLNSQMKSTISFTPIHSARPTSTNPTDHFSPISSTRDGRRLSSVSSNSLLFDTPNSSLPRPPTNCITSTPQTIFKTDCATEMSYPTNIAMINQLIAQMNLPIFKRTTIDYNPHELAKKFFYRTISFSSNHQHRSLDFVPKKQFLNIGRYEIEILFPNNCSNIYACDRCLKSFPGSTIAFQRHTSKCLANQPPGKLVYQKDDLAIFQIGETNLTIEQRLYMKFLFHIRRLFVDVEKTIDDTKKNQFSHYILCRSDPILSPIQSPVYRFLGYFSKQINQLAQQTINNLSCLFTLPCLAQQKEYHQLLISFSYFLVRSSNSLTNHMYSSPARPLDFRTSLIFQTYWREMFFTYLINHNHSSIKPLALDTFARQTAIHPRDILFSLYRNGFLRPHPTDKSSIYLRNHAYCSMTAGNFDVKNEILFMNPNDEKKMIFSKQNSNKSHDSGIEEIVLD